MAAINNNRTRRVSLVRLGTLAAAGTAVAALAVSCSTTPATVWTTSDTYAYDYYYPADVSYYGNYWVDSWYVDPFYYAPAHQAQTYTVDAGVADAGVAPVADAGTTADGGTSSGPISSVGLALRALARGDMVCPGQVTVTPKMGQSCTLMGSPGQVRTGAMIAFNGCMLANGGRIDGTVDFGSTAMPSDNNCDANTIVNVSYTATYTNLAYTAPGGARIVISMQTDKGTYQRPATAGPTSIAITTNGSLQRYDASMALVANHNYNGSRNYTISRPNNVLTVTVNGALSVQDVAGGAAVNISGTGITRTADCCRPTAGTLTLMRGDTSASWMFGPTCGQATVNGSATTLPASCE
jgi:hypothetical protein